MDQIACVSQDSYLFNDTVMNNLKIDSTGRQISDEEMIAACKKAGVHGFILCLENGYNTVVGSGGEKQRLSIASISCFGQMLALRVHAPVRRDQEGPSRVSCWSCWRLWPRSICGQQHRPVQFFSAAHYHDDASGAAWPSEMMPAAVSNEIFHLIAYSKLLYQLTRFPKSKSSGCLTGHNIKGSFVSNRKINVYWKAKRGAFRRKHL